VIKVLIQVQAGSGDRKLYNEKTLEYLETRQGARPYPYAYGFIVGTMSEDGDAVDCYVLTKGGVTAGEIVECEPVGLLEQDEDGEIDHKVLAVIPGQHVDLKDELLRELQDFIYAMFSEYPEMHVSVGPIRSREAALRHIQEFRNPPHSSYTVQTHGT
jgi:inorganic pyrophosphatase